MQTTIGDSRIGYDSRGNGGITLLLMHAFPLNRAMFAEQGEGLADVARVVTFDAPGVGNSERAKLSIDGMADTAAGLLDALQVRQAVVGGVSMGGYAALSFARRYPDRLQGLILSNTRAAADNDEGRQNRSTMAQLAMSQGSAAIAEQMLPKLLGATSYKKNRKLVDRIREMIETTPPNVIADLLAAMAERADSTDLLASIDVPTLVICGDEDVLTPAEDARQWSAAIPRSTLVVMENAGHLSNLEAPERYNLIVRNFLERF